MSGNVAQPVGEIAPVNCRSRHFRHRLGRKSTAYRARRPGVVVLAGAAEASGGATVSRRSGLPPAVWWHSTPIGSFVEWRRAEGVATNCRSAITHKVAHVAHGKWGMASAVPLQPDAERLVRATASTAQPQVGTCRTAPSVARRRASARWPGRAARRLFRSTPPPRRSRRAVADRIHAAARRLGAPPSGHRTALRPSVATAPVGRGS